MHIENGSRRKLGQELNLLDSREKIISSLMKILSSEPHQIAQLKVTFEGDIDYRRTVSGVSEGQAVDERLALKKLVFSSSTESSDLVFYISEDGPDEALLYGRYSKDTKIGIEKIDDRVMLSINDHRFKIELKLSPNTKVTLT